MSKVQIFYDYECPYCKAGYEFLMSLIGEYREIEFEWRPVESHPRPEGHSPHTDLCIQAYYAALELNVPEHRFHTVLFQAVAVERRNVEQIDVLTDIVKELADPAKFRAILESGKYADKVTENNGLADNEKVWYVPAFRLDGKKLDAKGGIGVTRVEIKAFLDQAR